MSIGVTYLVAKSLANAPFDQILDDKLTLIAQEVAAQALAEQITLPERLLNSIVADGKDRLKIQVSQQNGNQLLGETRDFPMPDMNPQDVGVVRYKDQVIGGEDWRVAYLWLELPVAGEAGPTLIQLAETLNKREDLANEIIKGVILPQFIILPIAVLLVWFGLSRGIAPLNVLIGIIRSRKPDDLSALHTTDTPEELLPVIHALNEQLERLQQTIDTQKRFIADAAHQLKTPLAGLRMQVDMLQDETDPNEQTEALKRLKRGAERSTRLVNQLLSLARTEAPSVLRLSAPI
ncbi:MAG: hypothetical protein HC848_04785 [Limnobacter sp.]|nr:hypothetical protein [Limnobacter sp.]